MKYINNIWHHDYVCKIIHYYPIILIKNSKNVAKQLSTPNRIIRTHCSTRARSTHTLPQIQTQLITLHGFLPILITTINSQITHSHSLPYFLPLLRSWRFHRRKRRRYHSPHQHHREESPHWTSCIPQTQPLHLRNTAIEWAEFLGTCRGSEEPQDNDIINGGKNKNDGRTAPNNRRNE